MSLHELETHWSLDDLLDAHLAIQVYDDAERLCEEERRRNAPPTRRR